MRWCRRPGADAARRRSGTRTVRTPLADAAEKMDRAKSPPCSSGADVNAAQADGMTALHWAVYHDDLPTATLLVKAGANAKAANRYGVTPLSLACTNGNAEIVELLLKAGADPNATLRGGETALMTAARTGKLGPVKALLARGAKVNAKDRKGQTALMWAAAEGHADVVSALLAAGAELPHPVALRLYALALCRAGRPHRGRPRAAEGGGRRQRRDAAQEGRLPRPQSREPVRCSWRSRTAILSWRSCS